MSAPDAPLSPVKRALVDLREMRARVEELERARTEPIAVVGIGCRFPGAESPEAFWSLLRDGVDAIAEVPKDRGDQAGWDEVGAVVRRGGFLDNVRGFDAAFFGIAPREAAAMDPQQRLLLEVTWEALEQGGIAPSSLAGSSTGVFVGISNPDHAVAAANRPLSALEAHDGTGGAFSVASGRVAYVLGTTGPSLSIDTACSSSLVAVHVACASLRAGESRLALAGGVNVILSPVASVKASRAGMLASDGRCKTFDATADGYVRGEGCGVVVLKRLADAEAAGDRVLAVIRGSAVNQDGRSGGLTVPSGGAQQAVIRQALTGSGVAPHEVAYVEAHGTGTSLGDPIEVNALAAALGPAREPERKLLLGSVKTNFGHLESAAGIAGLIKTILALQHGEIPAHLHLHTPSPHIAWATLPVEVVTTRRPWPAGRRVAGVSSFGFSGTNAHVVLEAPAESALLVESPPRVSDVLVISASHEQALQEIAASYARRLDHAAVEYERVCAEAAVGRAHLTHRLAVVGTSGSELGARLDEWRTGGAAPFVRTGRVERGAAAPETAFLFPGQGAQYGGMGRGLYEGEPVFRGAVERVAAAVAGELEHGLVEVLYGGRGAALEETAYTQVGLFAVEWALAEQWRAWGVEPAVVVGHSVGEFAAACVAGVLEVEAAARLVAARGRLMGALPRGGAMVAVHADEATVQAVVGAVGGTVGIAAVNGPGSVVVSGAAAAVGAVVERLTAGGVRSQGLRVSHAFHSALMEPMLGAFGAVAGGVGHGAPRGRWVSTVTGREVGVGEMAGAYWGRQIREPVRFADALTTARDLGATVFLEAGPHPVLTGLGREWLQDVGWVPSLRRAHDDRAQMLEGLAELYVRGAAVDWASVHGLPARGRVSLPTYPWQREEHWLDAAPIHRREADADARWPAIVAASRAQADQAPLDLDLGSYAGKWRALDELTRASILKTLQRLGLFAAAGEGWTVDDLIRARGIVPGYRPLLTRWLRRLSGDGLLLEVAPDSFVAPAALPDAGEPAALETARLALHDVPQIFDYVARCGARLAEFVTGAASPLETLFPGGALDTATALYQDWAVSRYFSAIAGAALSTAVETAAGRPVRVLEVGAGTGGTAAALIPRLAPDRGTYWFTDVSAAFLARAQERFGTHPFVRYAALDVEREPAEQGFAPASFDVVVATNVVHATRDVEATLRRLHAMLAPGGLLILGEATTHLSWFDVTTGLIEGWQRFEDDSRADSPLLEPEAWERLLAAVGFDAVASVPEASSPATVLGQHVVIARAPAADSTCVASTAGPREVTLAELRPTAATVPVGDVARRLAAERESDRHGLALEYVAEQVAAVLRVKRAEALDPGRRLMDLGLDSLMALELRGRLAVGLGRTGGVPATLVFEHPTIDAVARYVVREAMGVEVSGPAMRPAPEDPAAEAAAARIAHLSEDEVTALLMKKLESL